MPKKHKVLKITLLSILILIAVSVSGFFIWASDYYHAEDVVLAAMQGDGSMEVVDNLTILSPSVPSETGIIFYPGAKVEAAAYLPLLEKLKREGYTCVLVKMPLNMAIFDADAADAVFLQLPDIQRWYIAGHSMGGAMASDYAAKHPDKVEGLILLGAYIYGDYPPARALTIYGTFNANLEKDIHYTENIVKIDGGNHAQFGNYGKQKGDPDATISAQEQQDSTVEAIVNFIESKG
ncbi:MAG: alpha/beta fold hydrolase [Oscillospiraceae bacterium]|nr:alpha/beta fold hydrolase [Oscillospiraceae bacterium]